MQETFTTPLIQNYKDKRQVDIEGLALYIDKPEEDVDYTAKAVVYWRFGIDDAREWGINDLLFAIDKVCLEVEWEYTDEQDKEHDGTFELEIVNNHPSEKAKTQWLFENEIELRMSSLCPQNIIINLHKKTITVS